MNREGGMMTCSIRRWGACLVLLLLVVGAQGPVAVSEAGPKPPDGPLEVGFGEADITPKVGGKAVYIAGFGNNRKAVGVHDPLLARAVVLKHGGQKIALVSLDVVGLFRE